MSAHFANLPGKDVDVQSQRFSPVTSLMGSSGNGNVGRNNDKTNKKSNKLPPGAASHGGIPSDYTNGSWNYKSRFIAGGGGAATWVSFMIETLLQ